MITKVFLAKLTFRSASSERINGARKRLHSDKIKRRRARRRKALRGVAAKKHVAKLLTIAPNMMCLADVRNTSVVRSSGDQHNNMLDTTVNHQERTVHETTGDLKQINIPTEDVTRDDRPRRSVQFIEDPHQYRPAETAKRSPLLPLKSILKPPTPVFPYIDDEVNHTMIFSGFEDPSRCAWARLLEAAAKAKDDPMPFRRARVFTELARRIAEMDVECAQEEFTLLHTYLNGILASIKHEMMHDESTMG
jgi:hypothetical protein